MTPVSWERSGPCPRLRRLVQFTEGARLFTRPGGQRGNTGQQGNGGITVVKSAPVSHSGHAAETAAGAPLVRRTQAAGSLAERHRDQRPPVPQGLSLTGHSLTLSTARFSLDYSWRRMELTPAVAAASPVTDPPARPATDAPAVAPRSAHEVRRRAKLAQLLTSPHPSRRSQEAWGPGPAPVRATAPEACRRYLAIAQGPGRGERFFCA